MNAISKKQHGECVNNLPDTPKREQVAALCYRIKNDEKQVLLITSRDTGRWILPKGWPIEGKSAQGSALQEAWEEAGVKEGEITRAPLGTFDYQKNFDDGAHAICETQVFQIKVKKLESEFPECDERDRKWVSPIKASKMVGEPELQEILREF